MNTSDDIGSHAAREAIERAKRCAAVAGLAVALSSLAALPARATVTTTYDYTAGGTSITYHVGYATDPGSGYCDAGGTGGSNGICGVDGISLPEYKKGDLNFSNGLPFGWVFTVTANPTYAGAAVSEGTAGAYVNLIWGGSGSPIGNGETADFTAVIPAVTLIAADFGYHVGADNISIEPPIPNTQAIVAGVPEPTTVAGLGIGLAALLTMRRRRKV